LFGDVSACGNNAVSWFTEAICDEILTPNIDVDTLFTRVRNNIVRNHRVQVPASVNALLDKVVLSTELAYEDFDKQVHSFIKKYADEYLEKYGYYHGDDMIFIDAAQYFNISVLDAIWKFKKVDNKIYRDKGVPVPELNEEESKLVSFLGLKKNEKFFKCDFLSHTWYYDNRQIRMGEIPPLPASMQPLLPEQGKEIQICISVEKIRNNIVLSINLPDGCELFIWNNKIHCSERFEIIDKQIIIPNADEISKITIDSIVKASSDANKKILGSKCRNLTGDYIEHHPIYGNKVVYNKKM